MHYKRFCCVELAEDLASPQKKREGGYMQARRKVLGERGGATTCSGGVHIRPYALQLHTRESMDGLFYDGGGLLQSPQGIQRRFDMNGSCFESSKF